MKQELPIERSRARSRGVTLIEVMIVVVILGLISGAVAVAVFPQHLKAQIKMTQANAVTMRSAANVWRSERSAEGCPTPQQLRDARILDLTSSLVDAWNTPFKIVCHDDDTTVISLGPDRKESADDILAPEMLATRE